MAVTIAMIATPKVRRVHVPLIARTSLSCGCVLSPLLRLFNACEHVYTTSQSGERARGRMRAFTVTFSARNCNAPPALGFLGTAFHHPSVHFPLRARPLLAHNVTHGRGRRIPL